MITLKSRPDLKFKLGGAPRVPCESYSTQDGHIIISEQGTITGYVAYEVWAPPVNIPVDKGEQYESIIISNCNIHVQLQKRRGGIHALLLRYTEGVKDGGIIIVPEHIDAQLHEAIYQFNTKHGYVKPLLTI